jgi:hypothetical protein
MKPAIPDTGTVLRLEGDKAVIRMKHEGSCGKCGAAAIGLCKGGLMQELTVGNSMKARVGDTVKIGLVQALVFGAAGGHFLGASLGFPALDIIAGFASLISVSYFSLRRLKRLDSLSSIEVVQVLSGPWKPGPVVPDEETIPDYFKASF